MKKKDQILLEEAYQKINENILSKLNPFKKQQPQQPVQKKDPENNIFDWLETVPGLQAYPDQRPDGYEISYQSYDLGKKGAPTVLDYFNSMSSSQPEPVWTANGKVIATGRGKEAYNAVKNYINNLLKASSTTPAQNTPSVNQPSNVTAQGR